MVSEDFSFPRITNSLPRFPVSPVLWRVSSVVYPDVNWELEGEEKMDVLWEDFNEELQRVSSLGNKNKKKMSKSCDSGRENEQQRLQLCSLEVALKTSSGPLIRERNNIKKKQSFSSVLKAFKRVFSIQKSTQNKIKY